ncbi:MAG TPA: MFS transporter [Acidimicrobiales bacterium]|nr:MFS transporter [Acidimicrobiales bacterium]
MTGSGLGSRRRHAPNGVLLALACAAQFMVVLDVSIVNVALPSIGRDLHYSPTGLQWVVNAYVLTFAGFLLLGGRAADLFGRRRVFMFGLALFVGASFVGGFAQNAAWLTAARAVQGIGGAVLSPATLTIIITTYVGPQVPRALGVWSGFAGAGGAVGSILGGVLTATLSWRWVLFVNVPIGAALFVVAFIYLSDARLPSRTHKLDVAGAVTVTAGLAALVYAIVRTTAFGWTAPETLWTLAVAVALLGAFVVIERRVASEPLVPLGLFRSRSLSGANIVMILVGAAFFSMWYFLSLYLQNVLGFGPLRAGMAFVPMAVSIIVGAQVSSRLVNRFGARPLLLIGTALASVGFVWLSRIDPTSTYWGAVFGPGCLISLSLGLLFTPLASAATSDVPQNEAGLASGLLNTSRQVGGAIGLAALATVAVDWSRSLLRTGTPPHAALTAGYARAFEVAAVLGGLAFLAAFIVPVRRAHHAVVAGPGHEARSEPVAPTVASTEETPVAHQPVAEAAGEELGVEPA